ncbi:radical SAM protein [Marinobacter xestospongiae]|uniref:Radical SAM protein n=1 Tax=Marinobacter xestospongiae TaxID=994319 RepID=A0ABU3W1E5_9GAMM|nr:radical SAM protein [Marinobacter xestospongiae]MDV2080359.1 radical SAM protein [Marinobacter xestospongiae]
MGAWDADPSDPGSALFQSYFDRHFRIFCYLAIRPLHNLRGTLAVSETSIPVDIVEPTQYPQGISGRMHLQINWNCNYTCSYCFQNGKRANQPRLESLQGWREAFLSLTPPWKILITGGEPLLNKNAEELAEIISSCGHYIHLITNLSLPERNISNFINHAGVGLRIISASWHPEHISLSSFITKAKNVKNLMPGSSKFIASYVYTGDNTELEKIAFLAKEHQIPFQIRLMRKNDVTDRKVEETLAETAQSPWLSYRKTRSWFGHHCSAGKDYFVVDGTGHIYRCFSDLDTGKAPIGNFLKGDLKMSKSICLHRSECCMIGLEFPSRSDERKLIS